MSNINNKLSTQQLISDFENEGYEASEAIKWIEAGITDPDDAYQVFMIFNFEDNRDEKFFDKVKEIASELSSDNIAREVELSKLVNDALYN